MNISENNEYAIFLKEYENDIFFGLTADLFKKMDALQREVQLSKEKSNFVDMVSHQLRTPVSAIKWNLELLSQKLKNITFFEDMDMIRDSYRSVVSLVDIIDNLLLLEEIPSYYVPENKEKISLEVVVEDCINYNKDRIIRAGVVEYKKPDFDVFIWGEKGFIKKAVLNVVNNAFDYTPANKKITIRFFKENDMIVLEVSDEGIGIPETEKDKVFDKLFRTSNAILTKNSSSGIGLYLVKIIVEAHNGKIWFESTEGMGTKFYVALPEYKGNQ